MSLLTGDEAFRLAKQIAGEKAEDLIKKIDNVIQMVTDLTAVVSNKVDKEAGKGLSTNDYTTAEKNKLSGIAAGAEVNVNADWNANSGDAQILNKPANLVQDASYVHTDNNYTTTEKNKLSGIEAGAQVNKVTGVKGYWETSYRTGNVSISKANIGLDSVDNTSDADKPVSTAQQAALDLKVNKSALNLFDVVTPSFSSLPKTFYSSKLKSSCKLVGNAIELSAPKAGDIDWAVTFANGSLTISGTFHGSTATTAKMSVWLPTETITLTNS